MKCPRCGNGFIDGICPYCKSNQKEVFEASNSIAKKLIKKHDTENVYYTNYVPNDVSKKKLLLYTIFLGLFGVHNIYVGRYVKGYAMSICLIISILFVNIPESWVLYAYLSGIVMGAFAFVPVFCWWFDIILVLSKTYKIPIYLPKQ